MNPKLIQNPPGIGLALSAGGASGLAHIGVIQVLEEEGIPIAAVGGASMGAYIGSLWCAGHDGKQLEQFAAEIASRAHIVRLVDPSFPPMKGFLKGERLRARLRDRLKNATFDELDRPFLAIAADLDTFGRVILQQGNVSRAVHASCAIPGVCEPVRHDGRWLTDGGVVEPLPVRALHKHCPVEIDHVIAVTVVPSISAVEECRAGQAAAAGPHKTLGKRVLGSVNRNVNVFAEGNLLNILRRCLHASEIRLAEFAAAEADVLIHPFVCDGHWYDFENFEKYIAVGREATTASLPAIRRLLNTTDHPETQSNRKETEHASQPNHSPILVGL